MEAMIAADQRGYVTAAAVNLVMKAQEEPATLAATLGATLAVPDGQPLVWALKALGHPSATRIYGPDLMAHFCARAARKEIPDVPVRRARRARARAARASPARALPGHPDRRRALAAVSPAHAGGGRARARATSTPRARRSCGSAPGSPCRSSGCAACVHCLWAPLLVGVGAAFDFHAGLVSQAPPWMQRSGLEWAYRLSREPRRLWPRYARYNPRFVAGFARQYARYRRTRHRVG